jgi:hypothetical protein
MIWFRSPAWNFPAEMACAGGHHDALEAVLLDRQGACRVTEVGQHRHDVLGGHTDAEEGAG